MNTRLKDGGVSIDWAGLTDIKAWLYSDAQKTIAGRCDVSISEADSTLLVCEYSASKPQYPGVNRLIVQARYDGRTKTYDKPVFNFVPRTADQAGTQITMDDPEVDVEIVVEDVSSSILDTVILAAVAAAERAEAAAAEAEHMVDIHQGPPGPEGHSPYIGENGNWYEWDAEAEAYVDSGRPSRGPEGPEGPCVTTEDTGGAVEPVNLAPNVQYVTQELTSSQKAQARQNIGAGTSDFSGNYNDLTNKPVTPPVQTTQPAGGFAPNLVYDLGTLTGTVTFALATPADNTIPNTYHWTFETGSTAPDVTWPSNLVWFGGSEPSPEASKHYEITVRNGYATCMEF